MNDVVAYYVIMFTIPACVGIGLLYAVSVLWAGMQHSDHDPH